MAIVFGKTDSVTKAANRPVLAPVFERDITVLDETSDDAGPNPGEIRAITNFRGMNKGKVGRKHPLAARTVLDISPLGTVIPMEELPYVIEQLQRVQAELEDAGILSPRGK